MTTYEILSLIVDGLVMIAGFSAIVIYWHQRKAKVKTAATVILSQIDSIEATVIGLQKNQKTNVTIYRSKVVLDVNHWVNSKYLLSRKLGGDNVRLIDVFYEQAEEIEKSRSAVCHEIVLAWEHKDYLLQKKIAECSDMVEEERNRVLHTFRVNFEQNSAVFDPNLPKKILDENLLQFRFLSGTTAYQKIKKISYHS